MNTGEVCGVGQTDTTTAKLGSYCMKLTSTNTNGLTHLYSSNTLTIGNTYTFSLWILNDGTSATANVKSNSGFVVDTGFTAVSSNTEWVNYQITGEASATQMDIYIYSTRSGTIGEYIYVDNCSIKEEVVVPSAIELYEWSDFGTPSTALVGVEAATIKEDYLSGGGWRFQTSVGELFGVGQTDTTTAQLGDYGIKVTSNKTTSSYLQVYSPPVIIGKNYKWSVWIKSGVSSDAKWRDFEGFTTSFSENLINDDTWREYTFTSIATSTLMRIGIYVLDSGAIGEFIYIDNVSISQLD